MIYTPGLIQSQVLLTPLSQLQQKSAGKKSSRVTGLPKLNDANDAGTARSKVRHWRTVPPAACPLPPHHPAFGTGKKTAYKWNMHI